MSEKTVEERNLLRALQVTGLGISEATVLTKMINQHIDKPSQLVTNTGLSRGTVYSSLERLVQEGYVAKNETHPVTYSVVSGTLQKVTAELDKVKKSLARVSLAKTIESPKALEEISKAFERIGFIIRELPPNSIKRQRRPLRIRRVAEGEYAIGILIFDKGANRVVKGEQYSIPLQIIENQALVGAITTFVFMHPDFKECTTLFNTLRSWIRRRAEFPPFPRSSGRGIIGRPFFVFRTTDDIHEEITGAVSEIRRRRIAAAELMRRLKDQLSQAEQLIDACREHGRDIEEMILGKYRPFEPFSAISKEITKISDPVGRIRNRENRNLQIFKNRFNRISVEVDNYIDAFERRAFLPSSFRLELDSRELETVVSKLTPIEFELNDLRENLFSYAASFTFSAKEKRRVPLNPFMFTEPYEKDNFFVDQEDTNRRAPDLAHAIVGAGPNTFQIITGPAGCGKTHALRYIYEPTMEKNNVKTFYLDCPVSYDLIEFLSKELMHESYYSKDYSESIRVLRKSTPQTVREFSAMVTKIRDILRNAGNKGILIEIDELENMLPYPEERRYDEGRRPALALRQLQELLSRPVDNVGYVISCREKVYPMISQSLGIINIEDFTVRPHELTTNDLERIISRRYAVWNVDGPPFSQNVIAEIIRKVDGNARNSIRYCRELFKFVTRNNLSKIDEKTLKDVKEIPVFSY